MKYNLLVKTDDGSLNIEIQHKMNENSISLSFCIDGECRTITAQTTEYALLALVDTLKEKCTICSCLTCRHGNFCPIGDYDNEIFCAKDIVTKCVSDLYHITEDETERAKRVRTLFDVCSDFKPCSKEYFSYK